jgi:hypothetical protein
MIEAKGPTTYITGDMNIYWRAATTQERESTNFPGDPAADYPMRSVIRKEIILDTIGVPPEFKVNDDLEPTRAIGASPTREEPYVDSRLAM